MESTVATARMVIPDLEVKVSQAGTSNSGIIDMVNDAVNDYVDIPKKKKSSHKFYRQLKPKDDCGKALLS